MSNLDNSNFSKLSVLMSLYHAELPEHLDACLNSMMKQTCSADEIVIVFDGPLTKELYEMVELWEARLPIKTVKLQDNIGLGRALNFGLNHCKHEIIARMDTDDIALPSRFEKQLKLFFIEPELDICGSSIDEFYCKPDVVRSRRIPPLSHDDILSTCALKNPFNHMTVMYKKSKVLSVGSYQDLPWMEDWYLWLRMLSSGCQGKNINESLVLARTGLTMMARRSGIKYIQSEWKLTCKKVNLGIITWPRAMVIFWGRAFPRFLPTPILLKLYNHSRNKL
ncbi:hypothetical protein A9259_16820 [Vibrio cyclitrophicus]|uniref:glycosyltransferase n=1 Tax=Vibrio cyclitrophicus TaxID=47951 RepID=UPI0007EEAA35|nr:glycosyltransferase [Vibrio cyclitrophicus]OBS93553.1 hypothetical protein A9259_16820 [Vibrio cyclitrophicus]